MNTSTNVSQDKTDLILAVVHAFTKSEGGLDMLVAINNATGVLLRAAKKLNDYEQSALRG